MTTTPNCDPWMLNQEEKEPWTIAQEVGQLCNSGYTVSLTNFQEIDYVPNTTTANGCTCSWSIYNLLSACSFCVGRYQYTSWSAWTTNCGRYASNNSYLPSGVSLSQGVPFWATIDPSSWANAVFNITQASNKAAEVKPDVTSGPLLTSPTTASSSPGVSVGAIVGGVIGGIVIIIIGGLLIFWAVRRHRRQRTHMPPTGVPSFNFSQPAIVPSIWNRTPTQPTPPGYARASSAPITPYLTSPAHSTTSLGLTSLASPVSPGFSSSGHSAAPPITDAADMIAPFLATSSRRQTSQSNTSRPMSKAAEALSERVMSPPGQRARLNPPSYSASVEPGSSGTAITWSRRLSMKKHRKQEGSVSGTTTYSGHSRTSTRESVTTVRAGSRTVRSVESAVSAGGVGSVDGGGGGGGVEMARDRRAGVSDQRPPAV